MKNQISRGVSLKSQYSMGNCLRSGGGEGAWTVCRFKGGLAKKRR